MSTPEGIIGDGPGRGPDIRVPKPAANGSAGPAATPGAGPSAKPPPRFTDLVISAAELDALEIDPVGFVVEDLLPVGLAVLSAPPKVGKTWFDMALAEAVANGEPFAGCLPTDRGDVLLLDLEGNRRRAQSRLRRLRRGASAATSLEIANEWPRMDLGGLEMIRSGPRRAGGPGWW
jgi:hypothetical protein